MNSNNPYFKKVTAEYLAKQQSSEYKKFDNYMLAMQDKNFNEAESKYKALMLKKVKAEAAGMHELSISAEMKKLDSEKTEILKKLNIDLENASACSKCFDTGYDKDGKLCPCFKNRMLELMVSDSGIAKEHIRTFKDSDLSGFDNISEIEKIYEIMKGFVEKIDETKYKHVITCGRSGSGKTFLFSALAGELLAKGKSVFFTTAFNMNNMLLKYHTDFTASRVKYLDPFLESDVLIIDDLGTEQILKNVTIEYFLSIIKERELKGKHLLVNTNLTPDKINERYGERIYSRLYNKRLALVINMDTDLNLRLQKK